MFFVSTLNKKCGWILIFMKSSLLIYVWTKYILDRLLLFIPQPFMRVFTFSAYTPSASLMAQASRRCTNTAAARAGESCEVCNDRQTDAYFSEQEALKWAAVLHAPNLCPNWSRQLSVAWRGEKERRGNMAHSFQTVSLCLPWLWMCHSTSQWRPLFVWGRKRGYFVSIISGSLMFETVGV